MSNYAGFKNKIKFQIEHNINIMIVLKRSQNKNTNRNNEEGWNHLSKYFFLMIGTFRLSNNI